MDCYPVDTDADWSTWTMNRIGDWHTAGWWSSSSSLSSWSALFNILTHTHWPYVLELDIAIAVDADIFTNTQTHEHTMPMSNDSCFHVHFMCCAPEQQHFFHFFRLLSLCSSVVCRKHNDQRLLY